MEVKIEDNRLDDELQELYIETSHWQSDMAFLTDEIRFLKNALNKYLVYEEKLQVSEAARFNKILMLQEAAVAAVKTKITEFLGFIEPLITHSKLEIGLNLVEDFNALETEIKSLTDYVKMIRSLVFAFIEDAIKTGKYTVETT